VAIETPKNPNFVMFKGDEVAVSKAKNNAKALMKSVLTTEIRGGI